MIPKTHQDFIDKAIRLLPNDFRIAGIAAGGSYITNSMDEFSDIDLIIAVYPAYFAQVMAERFEIVSALGKVLAAFTGEHVGEPRLVICLYGPPLLHVDLKFVSLDDIEHRVEGPIVLWERENSISGRLQTSEARFPTPDWQWIEDRFWVWIHYAGTKIGRNELFETIDFISFLRQTVIGPMILMKNGRLPRGVRKIEFHAPDDLPLLKQTVPDYDARTCVKALQIIIQLYLDLRDRLAPDGLKNHTEAAKYAKEYLAELL